MQSHSQHGGVRKKTRKWIFFRKLLPNDRTCKFLRLQVERVILPVVSHIWTGPNKNALVSFVIIGSRHLIFPNDSFELQGVMTISNQMNTPIPRKRERNGSAENVTQFITGLVIVQWKLVDFIDRGLLNALRWKIVWLPLDLKLHHEKYQKKALHVFTDVFLCLFVRKNRKSIAYGGTVVFCQSGRLETRFDVMVWIVPFLNSFYSECSIGKPLVCPGMKMASQTEIRT